MKSKLIKAIVASVIVVGVCLGGFYGYKTYSSKKNVVTTTTQYLARNVSKSNLQVSVQGTGAAYAASTKEVAPNNNGTIEDLSVKVGDTVTAGQKLFVSDSDDVRKSVSTAQNSLAKQKLTLSSDQKAPNVDDNKIALDKLNISDATTQLNDANKQLSNMTVKAPIGGVVTVVNNSNGDSGKAGTSVLTVVDMSSMKVKVSVDELDINKIKIGQKSEIKFDAIKDKTYEGTVESIAQTGTSSNNVTTYDVVVSVTNPEGVKLGMNANVNILVENKENALVIPAEALVERNGKKYVRVGNNDDSQITADSGNLVEIKTGLETQTSIEVTEGLTEGQKVLVQMPKTSSTTNSNGGFGGNMGGQMPQGANMGGQMRQGNSTGSSRQQSGSSATKN